MTNAKTVVAHDAKAIKAMRADRKRGLTLAQIAEKWGVSIPTARTHTLGAS